MFVCPQHINIEKANGGQIFITVQTKFDRNIYEINDTETIEYIPVKVKLSSSVLCHYCAYIPMCSPNEEFELQKIHIRSSSANRQIAYIRWFRPPERTMVFIWHKSSCISTNKLWQWNRVYRLRHVIKSAIQVNEIHSSWPRVALFDILFYYSDPGNISVHESIGSLAHEHGNHKPVDVILDCSMVVRTSHCGAQITRNDFFNSNQTDSWIRFLRKGELGMGYLSRCWSGEKFYNKYLYVGCPASCLKQLFLDQYLGTIQDYWTWRS